MFRMKSTRITIVASVLLFGAVPSGVAQQAAIGVAPAQADRSSPGREGYFPQDPADSLYRAARDQLNRESYRRAAEMFAQLNRRYPRSSYAAQSMYYQAFALYKAGSRTSSEAELRRAQDALRELQRSHREAEIAQREARALMARIEGELAQLGDGEAAAGVIEGATGIGPGNGNRSRQTCEGGEDEIRVAALNALLHMNSEQAIPLLRRVLQERDPASECSAQLRRKAVFLLAQHLEEEDVDILLDVVRNDPDREVRLQAVFWLSQVPGDRTVEALEDLLRTSDDHELQEKAIFALSQTSSERAGQVLRDYAMRDGAPAELRANAIFWLGQQGRRENVDFLREIYGRTTEPEIKEKIIFSIAQTADDQAAVWLLQIAGNADESIEMRKKALFWAGQAGVSAAQMADLYDSMPERELKEQILFSLAQQGEREAIDKLLDIARNDTDIELRKKAIFWLSQTGDPRAAELLAEIIGGGQ